MEIRNPQLSFTEEWLILVLALIKAQNCKKNKTKTKKTPKHHNHISTNDMPFCFIFQTVPTIFNHIPKSKIHEIVS